MEVGLQEKKQQLSSYRCMEYVPSLPFKFAQFHHHLKGVNLKRKMSKCVSKNYASIITEFNLSMYTENLEEYK